ncbi:MAG: hypothetical protein KDB17_19920, partial [Ilumatobacter sp.]|nr:hypothetical protein [Ilumatobacter sp.]
EARPVLLHLSDTPSPDIGPWAGRVQLVQGTFTGSWELPVVGPVPAPATVLVRPDGHVVWVGTGDDHDDRDGGESLPPGLHEALRAWFGDPLA